MLFLTFYALGSSDAKNKNEVCCLFSVLGRCCLFVWFFPKTVTYFFKYIFLFFFPSPDLSKFVQRVSVMKPRKVFIHFRDNSVKSGLLKACRLLGYHGESFFSGWVSHHHHHHHHHHQHHQHFYCHEQFHKIYIWIVISVVVITTAIVVIVIIIIKSSDFQSDYITCYQWLYHSLSSRPKYGAATISYVVVLCTLWPKSVKYMKVIWVLHHSCKAGQLFCDMGQRF